MFELEESKDIHGFLILNRERFEKELLSVAVNVRDKINEIHLIGNINLLDNAHQLILLVVNQKEKEVMEFAQKEGILWAKHAMTLSFKLEWIRAIRKTFWSFLELFDGMNSVDKKSQEFYAETSTYNELIDSFINNFFISYSTYKDELIEKQRTLVNKLSVPIIPITPDVSILPLIGTIDSNRANVIEEKVLFEVGRLRIKTLIMDLSGIAKMDNDAIELFLKLLNGITMMGSKLIITGLRPEIVSNMMKLNVDFGTKVTTRATLQNALQDYLKIDQLNNNDTLEDLFSKVIQ
ncbi:STAS domain-containing protein [Ornithinibacillus halotolerans]|uniref:RsbT co-antagonist protein RsbRA n=1 Tax=Ornithinibacillus halotolerans TaxID=1274357 RepID=A0A916W3F2_9BACI|nr:STAS domain-containing protein [Ornithinibacillus halotolerans]GGA62732.1 RsbT co-antagonist protein RsbRA [Ornithinibacillus halotolerans]